MRKRWAGLLRCLAVIVLMALFTLGSLHQVGTDAAFHIKLHRELNSDQATGLTWQGVERAAQALVDCLKTNDVGVLCYEDTVYGTGRQVFNQREIAHMVDVAALFDLLRRVLWALAALALGLALTAQWLGGGAAWGRALTVGTLVWIALAGALALVCALDFSRAFIAFHHLFFTNDLWLMDPHTDLMIRLLPEGFFSAVAGRVALLAILWPAAGLAAGILLTRRERKSV